MGIDFSKFSKDFKAKFEAAAADKKVSLKEFNTFSQQDQATLTALLNNNPDALGNIVVVNAEYKSNNGGIFETYLGQSSNGLVKISDEAKNKYKGAVDGWIENGEFTLRDASQKPIKNADGTDVKFVLKEKADTNFRLPLGSETIRKEVRKFMISLLKEAYNKKENEFKEYLRNNQSGLSFKELGMELHDISSAIKDNLTKIGIPMDRTSTREEISQNLYNKGIQLAELSGSIDDEESFNKLFNNYFGTDFNYETAYDYMYDCMEWNNKDVKDKLTFAQESNDKFSKTFDDLTKNNFKTVDDYIGNSEKAGELLDLAFNVALMHVGASSTFAKATQMAAKGGAEMAESVMIKTLGKEAAESTIGRTVSQATGIVSAQTTNAGLSAVGFQSTKAADLASEAIVTGKINKEKAEQIGMSIESLFKFGYIGGAISGPLGMQVKGMTTRLLNSEPILKRVLTSTVKNKPIPLTGVLKNLSEHSEAIGTVLKFGTEFGINAGYMAYDEGISYENALKNLAQMDGVSKMVVAMLGGKNLEFLTPKKIQQIKTDLAGYKVNIAIKDGQKVYSIKDTKGQETILSTPEELIMFILDKEATTLGIKGNDTKPTETSSQKTETDTKVEAEKVETKVKTETKNDVNNTKKTYQRPELRMESIGGQDNLLGNIELKQEDFKVERIGTSQNKCGVLELQNSNGEQVGVVNYDLREVNGQKVLHFEGLKSNISGAGVGSKLVQELVNLSKELGAEGRVVATASPMMSPNGKLTNMGFYYKLGFKATDATKDAEIRQLLAEGKEIPISLNVFTNIELTPEGIVRNTITKQSSLQDVNNNNIKEKFKEKLVEIGVDDIEEQTLLTNFLLDASNIIDRNTQMNITNAQLEFLKSKGATFENTYLLAPQPSGPKKLKSYTNATRALLEISNNENSILPLNINNTKCEIGDFQRTIFEQNEQGKKFIVLTDDCSLSGASMLEDSLTKLNSGTNLKTGQNVEIVFVPTVLGTKAVHTINNFIKCYEQLTSSDVVMLEKAIKKKNTENLSPTALQMYHIIEEITDFNSKTPEKDKSSITIAKTIKNAIKTKEKGGNISFSLANVSETYPVQLAQDFRNTLYYQNLSNEKKDIISSWLTADGQSFGYHSSATSVIIEGFDCKYDFMQKIDNKDTQRALGYKEDGTPHNIPLKGNAPNNNVILTQILAEVMGIDKKRIKASGETFPEIQYKLKQHGLTSIVNQKYQNGMVTSGRAIKIEFAIKPGGNYDGKISILGKTFDSGCKIEVLNKEGTTLFSQQLPNIQPGTSFLEAIPQIRKELNLNNFEDNKATIVHGTKVIDEKYDKPLQYYPGEQENYIIAIPKLESNNIIVKVNGEIIDF